MKLHFAGLALLGVVLWITGWWLFSRGCDSSGFFYVMCSVVNVALVKGLFLMYGLFVVGTIPSLLVLHKLKKPLVFAYIVGLIIVAVGYRSYLIIGSQKRQIEYRKTHTPWYPMSELRGVSDSKAKLRIYTKKYSKTEGNSYEIIERNLDGSIQKRLGNTRTEPARKGSMRGSVPYGSDSVKERISPDGKFIARSIVHNGTVETEQDGIRIAGYNDRVEILDNQSNEVMNIQGFGQLYMLPEWSRDGRFVLYETDNSVEVVDTQTLKRYFFRSDPYESGDHVWVVEWGYE